MPESPRITAHEARGGPSEGTASTFSQRIERRKALWWAAPGGLCSRAAWRRPIHRFLDTHALRHHDWPMKRWRCCGQWQRSLNNKWNSREFAMMLGVPVPALYWSGRNLLRFPSGGLPSRFVVRRAWGAASAQTQIMVDGRELLDGRPCSLSQLRALLLRMYGPVSVHPLLVEEFLGAESGDSLRGVEYGFYCFGRHVGVITHAEREGRTSRYCAYDTDWNPHASGISAKRARADPRPRPARLHEMIAVASRLGEAYGSFVRVDLYNTASGIFFGEFSSTPYGGWNMTAWADAHLGHLWDLHCPGAT